MSSLSELVRTIIKTYANISPDDEMLLLMDLRDRVWQLEKENDSLRQENAKLKEQLAAKKKLECHGASIYILEDDGTETGPICPDCYQKDNIIMLLVQAEGGARCTRCKTLHAGVASTLEVPGQQSSF